MKHSKGKWESVFRSGKISCNERGVRNKDGFICFLPKPPYFSGQDKRYEEELEEAEANADFIVEAGNVTNETGYTPKQLAEQKAELLEALKVVYRLIDNGILVRDISKDNDFQYFTKQGIRITNAANLAYKAIKKATQ